MSNKPVYRKKNQVPPPVDQEPEHPASEPQRKYVKKSHLEETKEHKEEQTEEQVLQRQ